MKSVPCQEPGAILKQPSGTVSFQNSVLSSSKPSSISGAQIKNDFSGSRLDFNTEVSIDEHNPVLQQAPQAQRVELIGSLVDKKAGVEIAPLALISAKMVSQPPTSPVLGKKSLCEKFGFVDKSKETNVKIDESVKISFGMNGAGDDRLRGQALLNEHNIHSHASNGQDSCVYNLNVDHSKNETSDEVTATKEKESLLRHRNTEGERGDDFVEVDASEEEMLKKECVKEDRGSNDVLENDVLGEDVDAPP
jgi:hypothetical protein